MTYESPADDPRITAYVLGELSGQERVAFETELERSTELKRLVDETRQLVGRLQSELAEELASGTGAKQSQTAQPVAIDRGSSAGRSSWRPGRWAAIAGVALFAVTAAVIVSSMRAIPLARRAVSMNEAKTAVGESLRQSDHSTLAWKPAGTGGQIEEYATNLSIVIEQEPESGRVNINTLDAHGLRDELYDLVTNPIETRARDESLERPEHRLAPDEGRGPGEPGDQYDVIVDNPFQRTTDHPLSTFSIDVDTASYSKVRMFLQQHRTLPRRDAVRLEEMINYFPYAYAGPTDQHPFAAHLALARCPWQPAHQLVRVALKGREMPQQERPACNLVFLIDVSGSMDQPNKLPLLKRGLLKLIGQLRPQDRVAMVVYAGAAGMVLDSTPGDEKPQLEAALESLSAGGSTNGGDGIRLAYRIALDHYLPQGVNRVLLCTDGDFNVGTTGTDELVQLVQEQAKTGVALTVLGFGMGNHDDAMLEQISNRGNGNYAFVDTDQEAQKMLVEQVQGTLVTIAKDVKIQVEFNPREVAAYRLLGYENRILAAEDFQDDRKDAGEIGAGHTVTALYEIVPASITAQPPIAAIEPLKYQRAVELTDAAAGGELMTVKLRYKQPDGATSQQVDFPLAKPNAAPDYGDQDLQFATAVAAAGMLFRDSQYKGSANYDMVLELARASVGEDVAGYRQEFVALVELAKTLAGQR